MSQLLTASIADLGNTLGAFQVVSRCPLRFRAATRVLRKLFPAAGLLCVAAATIFSQQVKTIKSEQPVSCDGKNYQLRLVTAATTVGGKNATALAIVLTPGDKDKSQSSVFGLYWIDAKTSSPTHLDNPNGDRKGSLLSYGNGLTKKGEPFLSSFFSTVKCSSDPQAAALVGVLDVQHLPATSGSTPIDLEDVAQQLTTAGIKIDPELREASPASLDLFRNPSNNREFSEAIRQHVTILLSEEGRVDNAGYTPGTEQKIAALTAHNKWLAEQVRKSDQEKTRFFGGAPQWLILSFPLVSVLSLGALGLIGLIVYYRIRQRTSPDDGFLKTASSYPRSKTESNLPPADRVQAMITSAREQRQKIDRTYASLAQQEMIQNQKGKTAEALAETILQRMQLGQPANQKNRSKRIIEGVLEPITSIATETRQRTKDLDAAYADLQNQLEALLRNSTPSAQSDSATNGKSESTPAEEKINRKLVDLFTTCNDTMRAVQQTFSTLESIREKDLATSLAETKRLEQTVAGIKMKLDQDSENLSEFNSIQQSLSLHFKRTVKAKETVVHLLDEHSKAQQKLKKYHPAGDFLQTVDAVVSDYEAILRDTDQVLPGQSDLIHERVNALAREYRSVKPRADRAEEFEARSSRLQTQLDEVTSAIQAAEALVDEIILRLNFKTGTPKQSDQRRITATLNRLRIESTSGPYLQLRMGLSSAMIALEKAININASVEHQDLIEALFLNNVKRSLTELLGNIEECSGDQLWTDVIYEGFNDQWLHYLIRADLLLRTYYSSRREFSLLRKAVSLACTSILAALHDFQVEVVEVELFEKLPTNMETEAVYPGLRNLPAVVDKVGMMVQNIKTGDVVVDVTSFPVVVRGVQSNRGCASIANPSAWLQQ